MLNREVWGILLVVKVVETTSSTWKVIMETICPHILGMVLGAPTQILQCSYGLHT